ncbi:MAG TPA: hypothetical protein VG938_17235 [Verrucomicrobiae bacterium]|jgi:hypothetical protein|nr:hypothetical protein [Verrucomicrobiae bacterium]
MTLLDIERLIRKISDLLVQGGHPDAAPRLAEEYAAACHAANLRLQQCEAMIRANDRHQAIQLAETAPNLLGFIKLLEFRNANEWRAFCQQNALPAPERIDSRAVQALHQVYAQGISTDHPLYAAFRKAMLNRNDEEALNALRSIVRLNPSDANAASEIARVDAKVLAARLERLGGMVASGDAKTVAGEVEEIESAGFKTRPDGEIWRSAALVRCRVLLEEAERNQEASQWAAALAKIELVRQRQKDLRLELSADELRRLEALENWTRTEQEKDRKNREFAALLSELRRRIHESEEKDTSARYVELPEMRADFEALHKTWRALADFTRPIPEEAAAAFRKRSGLLEGEIARRMAVRRRVIMAGAAALLLAGTLIMWFVLRQMKARQFAHALENAISQRQTRVAERSLESVRTTQKSLLHSAAVNVAVADADSFVTREHGLLNNFENAFAKLPAHLTNDPDVTQVTSIAGQLAQTRAALNALSPDLKAENEPRLSAFERQWQQALSDAAVMVNGQLDQWVTASEQQCAQLDYRAPIETVSNRLVRLSGVMKKTSGYEAGFTNYVAVRSDLIQRAAATQARFDAYERELKKIDDGAAALKGARTFASFSSAVNLMATSEFSSAPATMAANAAQSLGTSEEAALRSLLDATNAATWAFVKKAKSPKLIPSIAMPVERGLFKQLNDDLAVNADHQLYRFWLDPNGTKIVEWITASVLDNSVGWKQIKAWVVSASDTNATFVDRDYGYFNGQWKLSPTQPVYRLEQTSSLKETAAFDAAELGKVWPGADTYTRPLLQTLDVVKDSDAGSPVFRAYLFTRLVELMEYQPDEWGLSFCPSARAGAAQIRAIVGGKIESGDWFVASKTNEWNAKLQEFFASAKSSSYLKQAAGNLALAQAVAADGLHYAGFAGLDGKPVLVGDPPPTNVWGYNASGKLALVFGPAMPLSPLFALPLPREDYLAKTGVDPKAPSFASGLLPLFRPKN